MTDKNEYQGPLVGLNVIDFGHYYAGPMAAMILADQGANVVRIVRPCKDESSTYHKELPEQQYRLYNRNKKLLALDLKTAEGKAQAEMLIENADVLIENFRPGVMKQLGLDYAKAKKKNPRLIYLSLPGFASTDKERAHTQAWEGILGAAAGLYLEANFVRKPLGYPPLYTSIPICSSYGAVHGAIAVMSALLAREDDGFGTVLEVPLVDAGLSSCTDRHILSVLGGPFQHPDYLRAVSGPAPKLPSELESFVQRYSYSSQDTAQTQLKKLSEATCPYFLSSDNKKMSFALAKPWHAERFYKALGIYDTLISEGFVNKGAWEKDSLGNNLTASYSLAGQLSPERANRVAQLSRDVLQTKSCEQWEGIMEKIGVPCATIRTRDEWLSLGPLRKSGLFTELDDGKSQLTVPGRIADISGPGGSLISISPREAEIIEEAVAVSLFKSDSVTQTSTSEQPPVKRKGDLLKGKKVLDLCSIVAGPNASHTLAQYGAEVIRLEPPQTFNLPVHLICCLEINQGKRSIILDIKTAPGRETFERLVRWADVVIHNRIDDIAKRLGVTHAQLQKINPSVVVCQIVALGATYRGGWENRLGFDDAANKPSGQYVHFGTEEYPVPFGGVSADLMAGLGTALSALLGLYQLQKTGFAGEGRSSLARATNYNQFPWMILENGSSDWNESRGQAAVGQNWWQRIYQCSDDWIYVGTSEVRAPLLAETVTGKKDVGEQCLIDTFATQSYGYWIKKLNAVDIAYHRVISLDDIHAEGNVHRVNNDAADERIAGPMQSLRRDDHPCGLPIVLPSPSWVRVGEDQSYRRLTPAPRVGQHTKEILAELGYGQNDIDELIRLKIAHEYLGVLGSKEAYFFEQVR